MKVDKSNRAEFMAALLKEFERLNLSPAQQSLVMHGICFEYGKKDGKLFLEVWKAIDLCHREKIRYPKWITDSLAMIAANILTDRPGVKARQRVFDATGIEGWEFGDVRRDEKEIDLSVEIEKLASEKYGIGTKGLKRAREEIAAQKGKAFSTIADRHKKIKSNPVYEDMINHYLRE